MCVEKEQPSSVRRNSSGSESDLGCAFCVWKTGVGVLNSTKLMLWLGGDAVAVLSFFGTRDLCWSD